MALFVALCLVSPAASPEPPRQSSAPEIRYVDFPARIDPLGEHKHVPLRVGSRVYLRPSIRVRELSQTADGGTLEHTEAVDAASRIMRLTNETLVVEPDGTERHFAATAVVDRTEPSRNFTIVVVPPERPVPAYLRKVKPDIVVR